MRGIDTIQKKNAGIEAGMNNTIAVQSPIFTNSYFYQHEIVDGHGNSTWPNMTFYGDDDSADNTTAHVSGIITGNITGDEFLSLLEECAPYLSYSE